MSGYDRHPHPDFVLEADFAVAEQRVAKSLCTPLVTSVSVLQLRGTPDTAILIRTGESWLDEDLVHIIQPASTLLVETISRAVRKAKVDGRCDIWPFIVGPVGWRAMYSYG
jgi:hypothetical protein